MDRKVKPIATTADDDIQSRIGSDARMIVPPGTNDLPLAYQEWTIDSRVEAR